MTGNFCKPFPVGYLNRAEVLDARADSFQGCELAHDLGMPGMLQNEATLQVRRATYRLDIIFQGQYSGVAFKEVFAGSANLPAAK